MLTPCRMCAASGAFRFLECRLNLRVVSGSAKLSFLHMAELDRRHAHGVEYRAGVKGTS